MNRDPQQVGYGLLGHGNAAIGIGGIQFFIMRMARQKDHRVPRKRDQGKLVLFRVKTGHDHGVRAFRLAFIRFAVPVVNAQQQYIDALIKFFILFNGCICRNRFVFRRVDDIFIHPYRAPEYRCQQYGQHDQHYKQTTPAHPAPFWPVIMPSVLFRLVHMVSASVM